mmetsp:Transcript_103098/g.277157  ORF Transcript_103098/g.277157 Transcript_103098/m.277157 type:complete len:201 (+) Transcript_103098:789-1391(+)
MSIPANARPPNSTWVVRMPVSSTYTLTPAPRPRTSSALMSWIPHGYVRRVAPSGTMCSQAFLTNGSSSHMTTSAGYLAMIASLSASVKKPCTNFSGHFAPGGHSSVPVQNGFWNSLHNVFTSSAVASLFSMQIHDFGSAAVDICISPRSTAEARLATPLAPTRLAIIMTCAICETTGTTVVDMSVRCARMRFKMLKASLA